MTQQPNSDPIYRVYTEGDEEGKGPDRTLGYATGIPEDIKRYYDDRKMYGIYLSKIDVLAITSQSAREKQALIHERANLERKLAEIDQQLRR